MDQDWLVLCNAEGIDPEEVRMVFSRYDAYRRFYRERRGESVSLDQWFTFYHMEKRSEGGQQGPSPSGCSVDSDAVNNACITRPGPFLAALKAYHFAKDLS